MMDQKLPRRVVETDQIMMQGNRTGNSSYYAGAGEMNFDAHMAVILAALLCALIGALGVNSIVRCVLRCGYRAEEGAPAAGLKKRELTALIPIGVYGSDANIKSTDCAICLAQFEEGDKIRMLPICNHGFHLTCIDTWLFSHSSCPNCRNSVSVKPPAPISPPPPPPPPHLVVVIETSN